MRKVTAVLIGVLLLLGLGTTFASAKSDKASSGKGSTPAHCDETDQVDPKPGGKNDRCPENPPCDADAGRPATKAKKCQDPGPEPCPEGEVRDENGDCVPEPCPEGEVRDENGDCVPEPCPEGEVRDTGTGECVPPCPDGSAPANGECPPTGDSFCRAQVVNLFGQLILFEANADGEPCTTEDGSLINEEQVRVAKAVTDEGEGSADAELVGLGGPADPGQLSVCGAHADGDEDAWLLLITSGGEEQVRLSGGDNPLPDLAMDDDNGIFLSRTEEDKAQCGAIRFEGDDIIVVSEAQTKPDPEG